MRLLHFCKSSAFYIVLILLFYPTGIGVCVQVVKNKLAPSNTKAELTIQFGKGICCKSEVLDLACEHRVIVKEGSSYFIKGNKFHGKEEALRFVNVNDGASDDMITTLRCHLFETQGI